MKQNKNKLAVIIVALIFCFSSFAYFLAPPPQRVPTIPLYTQTPLEEKDIAKIVESDKVLAVYIWSFDCENCEEYESELLKLVESFNGTFYLNSLNTYYYPDIPILDLPYLKLIGKKGVREFSVNLPNATELKKEICSLFEKEPKVCE